MSRTLTVGLIADPGLPERVASRLTKDLGQSLAVQTGGTVDWRIEASGETLPLTEAGEIPLIEHAPRLLEHHRWDAVVYLTDLPRRDGFNPIVAELGSKDRFALICLPALGAWRVAARTRALLVPLLSSLVSRGDGAAEAAQALRGTITRRTTPDGVQTLVRSGRLSRALLLAGMVRNNRPAGLLPALSTTAAAGIGTGAFGIFYASIWAMADTLPPARLALISVVVIAALSFWLIFYNRLWTTRRAINDRQGRWLDNAATVLTVGISVASMYLMLYLVLLVAALTVITSEYLESQLRHPVTILDYLRLSWLAASLGTMGGAIGSNFDSDRAVREATYSRREYERRQRAEDGDAS
ncbi:hypothetical protein [Pseudactinotalea suaedae]|uniref:hypothetical protein n=1 Tax=Pseudactinotalea suaedae TaxID=1524924 RepID=UPI0012E17C7F|nr:hypothetical protein [Pseudactinotalea suaedae]